MRKSLMVGLNEKDMQAVINTYDLKPFYYPSLFPLKENQTLSWKTLEAVSGLKIAADLVSRGATLPKKTRQAISKIQGDIPKLGISREMLEDELTEYDIFIAMAGNSPDLRALVEFWANDTNYCWTGIAAKAEYIALKQISLGQVKFDNNNNATVVTEYDVNYGLVADQKKGVNISWAAGTGAKPLTKDIPAALAAGKALFGATYKYAFMNSNTLAKFVSQEEVIKACASYLTNAVGIAQEPDLDTVNAMLRKKVKYRGLQIVEIDQDITIEKADGTQITGNPFEDDVVLFSESKVLGNTFWKKPIDLRLEGSTAVKAMRGHTLIKKYSEESPVKEVTEGIANLFPAWNLAGRSVLMQTNKTTWDKN